MSKLLAFANMKGGVGKSTAAMFVADFAALGGAKVLAVDLDSQANLSVMLLGSSAVEVLPHDAFTLTRAFDLFAAGEAPSSTEYIRTNATDVAELSPDTAEGCVHLIPASPRIRFSEIRFETRLVQNSTSLSDARNAARDVLEGFLRPIRSDYDLIILDCPPALTLFSQAAIMTANLIITPVIPDEISAISTKIFLDIITDNNDETFRLTTKNHIKVLFSKYRRTQLADTNIRRIGGTTSALGGVVRQTDDIARAGMRLPLGGKRTIKRKYGSEFERLKKIADETLKLIGDV